MTNADEEEVLAEYQRLTETHVRSPSDCMIPSLMKYKHVQLPDAPSSLLIPAAPDHKVANQPRLELEPQPAQ